MAPSQKGLFPDTKLIWSRHDAENWTGSPEDFRRIYGMDPDQIWNDGAAPHVPPMTEEEIYNMMGCPPRVQDQDPEVDLGSPFLNLMVAIFVGVWAFVSSLFPSR